MRADIGRDRACVGEQRHHKGEGQRGEPEPSEDQRRRLDLAIGGLAARPAVASVIAGATKPEQVRANAAAGQWAPTPEEMAAVDPALRG